MPPQPSEPHSPADAAHASAAAGPGARLALLIGGAAAALVLAMTPHFEGTVKRGYADIGGVVTACTGHTLTAQLGRTYTAAECEQLLAKDLVAHWWPLARCITVPMAPHTKAALLDLAFNVGPGAVCRGSVARHINAGRLTEGCAAILQYVYVRLDGRLRDCREPAYARRCGGIVTRRQAEAALCAAPPTGQEPYL